MKVETALKILQSHYEHHSKKKGYVFTFEAYEIQECINALKSPMSIVDHSPAYYHARAIAIADKIVKRAYLQICG